MPINQLIQCVEVLSVNILIYAILLGPSWAITSESGVYDDQENGYYGHLEAYQRRITSCNILFCSDI